MRCFFFLSRLELHFQRDVCLRSEWVSAVFVHYTIYCQSSFHFSLQKTVLTGEKMNEKLCTNWSEKTFDNNRFAQHSSMAQKEEKKDVFYSKKLRKREANFVGKEVLSCFVVYRYLD